MTVFGLGENIVQTGFSAFHQVYRLIPSVRIHEVRQICADVGEVRKAFILKM
jgi:hypothetical protein